MRVKRNSNRSVEDPEGRADVRDRAKRKVKYRVTSVFCAHEAFWKRWRLGCFDQEASYGGEKVIRPSRVVKEGVRRESRLLSPFKSGMPISTTITSGRRGKDLDQQSHNRETICTRRGMGCPARYMGELPARTARSGFLTGALSQRLSSALSCRTMKTFPKSNSLPARRYRSYERCFPAIQGRCLPD
jgi:hypothetical protein